MTEQKDTEQLAREARRLFDESVEGLDANALSRLNRGRHEALAELGSGRTVMRPSRWVPAAGVAAAAVAVVVVMRGPAGVDVVPEPVTVTDFEILLDEQSLEMLEDLEFYSWLESVDLDAGDHVG